MTSSASFPWHALRIAVALSLAAAVSLGITRFAYGLLLPPMRADLGWSYALAGGMNTANAAGYLVGALSSPWLIKRLSAPTLLLVGSAWATVFMAASGFFEQPIPLLAQRLLAGIASAWVFVAGGLLAARLGSTHHKQAGLLLGVFYGGVGWGIALSAWLVPVVLMAHAEESHGWAWAWWWLAGACALATLVLMWPVHFFKQKVLLSPVNPTLNAPVSESKSQSVPLSKLGYALAGYTFFGVGYIGYMTFVIALLRDRGWPASDITWFYALLGLAVVASSRLWAGLLDKAKGGGALATLNALLGLATVLPAVASAWGWMLLSGLMFGGVFLSVVASTTALVRHNLPMGQWPAGISAFTVVFAIGQIVGPSMVGWIADGAGGLEQGLLVSAVALWVGGLLAWQQQPLQAVN